MKSEDKKSAPRSAGASVAKGDCLEVVSLRAAVTSARSGVASGTQVGSEGAITESLRPVLPASGPAASSDAITEHS